MCPDTFDGTGSDLNIEEEFDTIDYDAFIDAINGKYDTIGVCDRA